MRRVPHSQGSGGELDKLKVEILREWEFPEISRIVVSLAAIIRSSWEAHPVSDRDPFYRPALMRRVGSLVPDLENSQEQEPLDFREACNKVIHAKSVEPETAPAIQDASPPLTGRLVLYGNYREKEWRADLDLKEYAFSALTLNP